MGVGSSRKCPEVLDLQVHRNMQHALGKSSIFAHSHGCSPCGLTILPPKDLSLIQRPPCWPCHFGHIRRSCFRRTTNSMPTTAAKRAAMPVVLCKAASTRTGGEGSGAACLVVAGCSYDHDILFVSPQFVCKSAFNRAVLYTCCPRMLAK